MKQTLEFSLNVFAGFSEKIIKNLNDDSNLQPLVYERKVLPQSQ